MKISTTTDYLNKGKFQRESDLIGIHAKAGFTVLDHTPHPNGENWREDVLRTKEEADKYGVVIEQTHAPYNRYKRKPLDEYRVDMDNFIEAAHLLGVRRMVIHADDFGIGEDGLYKPERTFALLYEFWAPYVDRCKKLGIEVAIENLFEDHFLVAHDQRSRYTSTVEELLSIIEKFGDPMVRCCWDFGHARVAFGDGQTDAMKALGKYITCTHVHDNGKRYDDHLVPFLGTTDWNAEMRAMKEFGYKGNLTFEMVYGDIPSALHGDFLTYLLKIGEHMRSVFDRA